MIALFQSAFGKGNFTNILTAQWIQRTCTDITQPV